MNTLQRVALEVGAGLGLILVAVLGWNLWLHLHNVKEQKQGATACIISTTEVKTEVAQDNSKLQADHAAQLSKVVAIYESKLGDAARTNADIARGMRDYQVRQNRAAGARCAAPGGGGHGGLSESQGEAPAGPDIAGDTQAVLDACDADHGKLILVTAAYDDWRAKMLAAQ